MPYYFSASGVSLHPDGQRDQRVSSEPPKRPLRTLRVLVTGKRTAPMEASWSDVSAMPPRLYLDPLQQRASRGLQSQRYADVTPLLSPRAPPLRPHWLAAYLFRPPLGPWSVVPWQSRLPVVVVPEEVQGPTLPLIGLDDGELLFPRPFNTKLAAPP